MSALPYEPIWGELGVEVSILDDFFKDHPVRVSVGLARAGAEDGAFAFVCPQHLDMGLVTKAEYVAHLRAGHESNCISCGESRVVADDLIRWKCEFAFPVRVIYPNGRTVDGVYPGGSHIFWGSLAQRCAACLQRGLGTYGDIQQHDQARREWLRAQVHRDDARYGKE